MATQSEQSLEVVKRYNEIAIPRLMKGDRAAARDFVADHFVQHTSTHHVKGSHGHEDRAASIEEAVKAIPDLRFSVKRYLADGEYVVAHWQLEGTHAGRHKHRLQDDHVEGTNAEVDIQGMTLYHVQHGKISETWSYDSHLDFLIEAGALTVVKSK